MRIYRHAILDPRRSPADEVPDAATPPSEPEPPSGRDDGAIATAIDWADVAAMLGDYQEALWWLSIAERAAGRASAQIASRRELWEAADPHG